MSPGTLQRPPSSLPSRRTRVATPCASRTTGVASAPERAAGEVSASGWCGSVRKRSAVRARWRALRDAGRSCGCGCLAGEDAAGGTIRRDYPVRTTNARTRLNERPESETAETLPQVKVMVVDDHQLLTESLLMVFEEESDMTVVATAASVAEARLKARRHLPDVVLMDYRLPDGLGTDAARFIREENPDIRIVMLTGFPDDAILVAAIEAGCSGYITKDSAVGEAISAVRAAHAGEALISPAMLARLLPKLRRDHPGGRPAPTRREREGLKLPAPG